jgi:hypothetical protein
MVTLATALGRQASIALDVLTADCLLLFAVCLDFGTELRALEAVDQPGEHLFDVNHLSKHGFKIRVTNCSDLVAHDQVILQLCRRTKSDPQKTPELLVASQPRVIMAATAVGRATKLFRV